MTLEEMEMNGFLVREEFRKGEVAEFRSAIAGCLADARNADNFAPNRLELAYKAILKSALLALRVRGLRLKSSQGHHRFAMESLEYTIGVIVTDVDYFCDLAQMRHDDMYNSTPVSDADLQDAIAAATTLSTRLDAWLRDAGLLAS